MTAQISTASDAAGGPGNEVATTSPGLRLVLATIGRHTIVGLISGAISGFVAGGIGSRLAMRIVAIAGGPEIQGMETEAGATVGEITGDGTAFLLIFGGLVAGGIAGLVYPLARSWFPARTAHRALLYGLLAMLVGSALLLDKDNPDFRVLGNPGLSAAMFAFIPFVYGVLQVFIAEWLYRRIAPVRSKGFAAMVYIFAAAAAILPGLVVGLSAGRSWQALAMLAVVAIVYALVIRSVARARRENGAQQDPLAVRALGYLVILAVAAIGSYRLVDSLNAIL